MNSMAIKKLSNLELDLQLKNFVSTEREVLGQILNHIVEIDRRKLYLSFAFPSLFEYLTKHIGYSAGSAQRRIDAARLSREVPEVIEKLEEGTLNLAQISLVQKTVRQSNQQKQSNLDVLNNQRKQETKEVRKIENKISISVKRNLLSEISGKSFSESQVLVSKHLDLKIKEQTKENHQKDESVRLELTLSKQQWEKLNQMRDLLSHSLPNGSWDQLLEYLSDKVIAQKQPKKSELKVFREDQAIKEGDNRKKNVKEEAEDAENKIENNRRIHIPKAIRNYIFERDRCCQYVNENNGKVCASTWQLQVDHIQPVWAGGKDTVQNLRLLCANHNREIYKNQSNTQSI